MENSTPPVESKGRMPRWLLLLLGGILVLSLLAAGFVLVLLPVLRGTGQQADQQPDLQASLEAMVNQTMTAVSQSVLPPTQEPPGEPVPAQPPAETPTLSLAGGMDGKPYSAQPGPASTPLPIPKLEEPCVAYYDVSNGDLKYGCFNGKANNWKMAAVDSEGDTGHYPSLAFDGKGNPHIAYYDLTNGDLRYATLQGESWTFETVDAQGDSGVMPSMALEADGSVWISYFDRTNWQVKVAHKANGAWSFELVDGGMTKPDEEPEITSYNTSLVLDRNSSPLIAYIDFKAKSLRFAYRENGQWYLETVYEPGEVDWNCSLALDANGLPGISFHDRNKRTLNLARFENGAWSVEQMEKNKVGKFSSMAFDSENYPRIAYLDDEEDDLRVIGWNGFSLFAQKVDYDGNVGLFPSLTLNSKDKTYITYYDFSARWLKFTYQPIDNWYLNLADNAGQVGKYSSLKMRRLYE